MASNTSKKPASKKAPAKALATRASRPGTDIATIDAELQNEVANLKDQLGAPSGNKIKVEVTGDFVLPSGENLGDEIQVVVVDFVSRNTFYATPYNPNNITPPDCYAMGRVKAQMAPEEDSPDRQSDMCASCPQNQFGSGQNGTSKACSNRYWLAVLLVDPDDDEAHNAPDAPIYLLDLPPKALKSFEAAARLVATSLSGPPVKAVLTVRAKNAGTYALISFHDPLPNPDYAAHYARRAEVQDMLFRKPDFAAYEASPPVRGRGAARAPARRAAPARR